MKGIEYRMKVVNAMNAKISNGKTGSPQTFATDIAISKRTLFENLKLMKENLEPSNVLIIYNRKLVSYHYSPPGDYPVIWVWLPKN